ncbi:MAG: PIN domain-containing protein [Oscillospiraceae bacterium]|jgi:predicted nucleic acid-binding protein|nr:PIN domain-containing protein [Oscillospiraceae bacterium]
MSGMRVYLETTVFNRYFEHEREYSAETERLFDKINAGEIEAYTSATVLEEIDKAPEPKREQMLELIRECKIEVLETDSQAYDLADLYIEMGIIPSRFRLDGVHIAMAAIHNMDVIVSLNFHHINKLKTKTATEIVHRMEGYGSPIICTPMEVLNDE